MPQAQELNVVRLDETDRAEIFELVLPETERAQVIYLRVYLLSHLLRENDALVPAFEVILTAKIGVLVENDLIHIEFIQVRVEK
jgi:hypothetical protein